MDDDGNDGNGKLGGATTTTEMEKSTFKPITIPGPWETRGSGALVGEPGGVQGAGPQGPSGWPSGRPWRPRDAA